MAPIPENLLGATVSDMWNGNDDWKWDVFSNYLPEEELKKIAAYSLSIDPDMEDCLYWNGTSHGKFSIQSALAIIKGADIPPENNPITWHVIWKLPVQQRVRMFMWLAAHGRLMTNYNRVKRNLADDPICPRCNLEDETSDHLLRKCPMSEAIWSQLDGIATHPTFFSDPYAIWITKNASNGSSLFSPDWSMKYAITCWWLWRWRNNVAFGRADANPIDPIRFLLHQFEMSKKAFDPFSLFIPTPGTSMEERYIRWHTPPNGWVLLNTDGASKGNPGLAGCGGLMRDDAGNFLMGFLFSCGVCTSMRAEMRAVVHGLEQARATGYNKVLVHMDNKSCVDFILSDQLLSNSLRPLVRRCKNLIGLAGWTVRIEHAFREANRAADWLANAGVHAPTTTTTLNEPPDGLRSILREDLLGVAFPRLVTI